MLFFAVIIILAVYADKKRTDALKAMADSLGFSFSKKGNESLLQSLSGLHLFSQGHGRTIKNAMNGFANGIDVTIFDYKYTTGGGKNSHTYSQTVILFQSDQLQLPDFTLRLEHVFHKIGSAFGYQDIDFSDHPAFSKKYLLRGTDEDSIRRVFSNELLKCYEQHPRLSTEAAGNRLIYYRSSKKTSSDKIRDFFEEAFAVFALLNTET